MLLIGLNNKIIFDKIWLMKLNSFKRVGSAIVENNYQFHLLKM